MEISNLLISKDIRLWNFYLYLFIGFRGTTSGSQAFFLDLCSEAGAVSVLMQGQLKASRQVPYPLFYLSSYLLLSYLGTVLV